MGFVAVQAAVTAGAGVEARVAAPCRASAPGAQATPAQETGGADFAAALARASAGAALEDGPESPTATGPAGQAGEGAPRGAKDTGPSGGGEVALAAAALGWAAILPLSLSASGLAGTSNSGGEPSPAAMTAGLGTSRATGPGAASAGAGAGAGADAGTKSALAAFVPADPVVSSRSPAGAASAQSVSGGGMPAVAPHRAGQLSAPPQAASQAWAAEAVPAQSPSQTPAGVGPSADPIRAALEFYLRALGGSGPEAAAGDSAAQGNAGIGPARDAAAPAGFGRSNPAAWGVAAPQPALQAASGFGGTFTPRAVAGSVPGVQPSPRLQEQGAVTGGGAGSADGQMPVAGAAERAAGAVPWTGEVSGPDPGRAAAAVGAQPLRVDSGAAGAGGPGTPNGPEIAARYYTVAPATGSMSPGQQEGAGSSTTSGAEDRPASADDQGEAFTGAAARPDGATGAAGAGEGGGALRSLSGAGRRPQREELSGDTPERGTPAAVKQRGPATPDSGASEAVAGQAQVPAGADPQPALRETARLVASHVTRWIEQLPPAAFRRAEVVAARIAEDGGQIRLQLHPPEMGELRVVLNADGSRLTVHVVAQQPDTGQLLRQHAGTLEQALEQAGLHLAGFSVEVGHQATGGQQSPLPWPASVHGSPAGAWARSHVAEPAVSVRDEPAWVRLGMAAVDVRV